MRHLHLPILFTVAIACTAATGPLDGTTQPACFWDAAGSFGCNDEEQRFDFAAAAGSDPAVISLFGSSVCDGAFCSGNCSGNSVSTPGGCYQSRLKVYQESASPTKRSIFNNAHGGDTTSKLLARFDQVVSTHAGFVVIGLSLSNEGLRCCGSQPQNSSACSACHSYVYDHYATGMKQLITEIEGIGARPVIQSCYPNSDYSTEEYALIRSMNMLTQTWGYPQTNFLGTIDNGQGQWAPGYHANSGHPNDAGSTEMYYSIVPSLFDAIVAGKPAVPQRLAAEHAITLHSGGDAVILSIPAAQTVHSFTLAFDVRMPSGVGGRIATIHAEILPPPPAPPKPCGAWCAEHGYQPDKCGCGVCGSFGFCSFSCDPSQNTSRHPLTACPQPVDHVDHVDYGPPNSLRTLQVSSAGVVEYSSGNASLVAASTANADGEWHMVLLTHFSCNGTTNLYVDGVLAAQAAERIAPSTLSLGWEAQNPATTNSTAQYREMLVYRSGLNSDEVSFLMQNRTTVLQASLEVYAPLNDSDQHIINLAQSTTELHLGGMQ